MTCERARSWRAGKHRTGSDGEIAPQFFGPVAVGDDATVADEAEEYGEFQYPLEHDGLLRLNDERIVFACHGNRFDPHQFRIAAAALPRAFSQAPKERAHSAPTWRIWAQKSLRRNRKQEYPGFGRLRFYGLKYRTARHESGLTQIKQPAENPIGAFLACRANGSIASHVIGRTAQLAQEHRQWHASPRARNRSGNARTPDASTRLYRLSRRRRRNGWRKKQDGPIPTWSITRVLREASSTRDVYSCACAGVAGGSGIAGAGTGGFALRAFTTFARDTLFEERGVFFVFRADCRDGRLAVPAAERAPAVTAAGSAAGPSEEPAAGVSPAPPFAA
jgi:hypothetical protein